MTLEVVFPLIAAALAGGLFNAAVNGFFRRKVTDSEVTSNLVDASAVLANNMMKRLEVLEDKVEHLEEENRQLRNQLFRLGHEPVPYTRRANPTPIEGDA